MRHGCGRRSSMPMFDAWRNPYNIASLNFLNWGAPLLDQPRPRRDDQRLTQWVRVPSSTSARLERDGRTSDARRVAPLER